MGRFSFFRKQKKQVTSETDIPVFTAEETAVTQQTLACNYTVGEIIFLHWLSKNDDLTNLPKEFDYSFQITPKTLIRRFEQENLLTREKTTASLRRLSRAELEQILASRDLPTDGRLLQLVTRILEHCQLEDLDIPEIFTITDAGQALLNDHLDYIRAYKDRFFDLDLYTAAKAQQPDAKYDDVKQAAIASDYSKQTIARDFSGLLTSSMAQADMARQAKQYPLALSYWFEVLLREVAGANDPDELPNVTASTLQKLKQTIKMGALDDKTVQRAFQAGKGRFFALGGADYVSDYIANVLMEKVTEWSLEELSSYLNQNLDQLRLS